MSSIEEESSEQDIEAELTEVLNKVGPQLQNAIKRGFTNVAVQQSKNGENVKPETIDDVSYSSKNTQVNLQKLEFVKKPSFHATRVSLSLESHTLGLHCSLGDISLKGLYSAYNENLYNLIPVMSEGHLLVSVSNMTAEVNAGLVVKEDSLVIVNPVIEFGHDEVLVRLSWPSPQLNGGYDFTTTELLAKNMDELPLTNAVGTALNKHLRCCLTSHLELVLQQTTGVSDMLCGHDALIHAYNIRTISQSDCGRRALDVLLINVRRTLLQGGRHILQLPILHASFTHKIGPVSFVGKLETDTGWIKNLATVNRASDVTVYQLQGKTVLSTTLHIRDLQIGFNDYRVKCVGVGATGRILVSVGENRVSVCVTCGVAQWGVPYAQLNRLTVDYLDKLDIHITGLGPLNWLTSQAKSWLYGHLHAYAIPYIEKQLSAEMQRAFTEVNTWDLLQGKS